MPEAAADRIRAEEAEACLKHSQGGTISLAGRPRPLAAVFRPQFGLSLVGSDSPARFDGFLHLRLRSIWVGQFLERERPRREHKRS